MTHNDIPKDSIDCIVTSPPYLGLRVYGQKGRNEGNTAIYNYATSGKGLPGEIGRTKNIANNLEQKKYFQDLLSTLKFCYRILKKEKYLAININKIRYEKETLDFSSDIIRLAKSINFIHRDTIIWIKDNPRPINGINAGYYLDDAWEYILLFSKGDAKLNKENYIPIEIELKCRVCGNSSLKKKNTSPNILYPNYLETHLGYIEKSKLSSEHPAKFPLKIPNFIFNIATHKGNTVFDPFCGIGTTLVAGLSRNLNVVGCDLSKIFCESSVREIRKIVF